MTSHEIQELVTFILLLWQKIVKQDLEDNLFPRNLSYVEKILQQNCKGKTFFFGDKVFLCVKLSTTTRIVHKHKTFHNHFGVDVYKHCRLQRPLTIVESCLM